MAEQNENLCDALSDPRNAASPNGVRETLRNGNFIHFYNRPDVIHKERIYFAEATLKNSTVHPPPSGLVKSAASVRPKMTFIFIELMVILFECKNLFTRIRVRLECGLLFLEFTWTPQSSCV